MARGITPILAIILLVAMVLGIGIVLMRSTSSKIGTVAQNTWKEIVNSYCSSNFYDQACDTCTRNPLSTKCIKSMLTSEDFKDAEASIVCNNYDLVKYLESRVGKELVEEFCFGSSEGELE